MDRAAAPVRGRLLLTVCWVLAGGTAAGANVLPPPSNLEYSFIEICTLNWTWNPPENVSSGCDLEYSSYIVIDKVPQDNRKWSKSRFRVMDTFLNEEIHFKVRSECKNTNTSEPSQWVEASLLPEGVQLDVDENQTWTGESETSSPCLHCIKRVLWKIREADC